MLNFSRSISGARLGKRSCQLFLALQHGTPKLSRLRQCTLITPQFLWVGNLAPVSLSPWARSSTQAAVGITQGPWFRLNAQLGGPRESKLMWLFERLDFSWTVTPKASQPCFLAGGWPEVTLSFLPLECDSLFHESIKAKKPL